MLGKKKRNTSFFNNTVPIPETTMETPMLSKEEQNQLKHGKKQSAISMYKSENIVSFSPDDEFLHFRSIKNEKIPFFISGIEELRDEVTEVYCNYCGKLHSKEESIFIPLNMYKDGEKTVFEGEKYFNCFECAYRFILSQISFFCGTSPHIYQNALYYLHIWFKSIYPEKELAPAPKFENMNEKWSPKYIFRRVSGYEFRRVVTFYECQKVTTSV